MDFFKDEQEVRNFCDAMEHTTTTEVLERVKSLEISVRSETRRQLEELPYREESYLLRDTYETLMKIINFNEFSTEEIYENLSRYVLGHTRTFIDFNPPLRRIEMLVKSMRKIYSSRKKA